MTRPLDHDDLALLKRCRDLAWDGLARVDEVAVLAMALRLQPFGDRSPDWAIVDLVRIGDLAEGATLLEALRHGATLAPRLEAMAERTTDDATGWRLQDALRVLAALARQRSPS